MLKMKWFKIIWCIGDEDAKRWDKRGRKDGARKDIGYVMFEQELNSEEEELVTDTANKWDTIVYILDRLNFWFLRL